jgi:hypothetical protein
VAEHTEDEVDAGFGKLAEQARQTPRLKGWVAVSVVLNLCLSAGLAYGYVRTSRVAQRACQAAKAEAQLWEHALTYPPPPGQTPAQAARRDENLAAFGLYLHQTASQRTCSR